jgi:integrase
LEVVNMPRVKQSYQLFKRTLASGKVWYYRLPDDPTGSAKSTGVPGTEAGKPKAMEYVEGLIRGEALVVPTLEEYAKDFFNWEKSDYLRRRREQQKRRQLGRGQALLRHGHVHNYLIPRWGKVRLNDINLSMFEDWLYSLKGLSNQTKNHILYTANLILKEAVRRRVIKHNPIEGIEALDPSNKRRDYLRTEELEALFPKDMNEFLRIWPTVRWKHLGEHEPINYGVMAALAVSGGLRSGEIRALRWKHVSFENGGVAVLRTFQYGDVEGQPKQGSSRVVLLPQRTMDLLEWWQSQSATTSLDDYAFPFRAARNMVNALRKAMKTAEINYKGRYLDVHALRHTYNTHMRELIEDVKLQQFTGHRSAKMTENYDQKAIAERYSRFQDLREKVDLFPI